MQQVLHLAAPADSPVRTAAPLQVVGSYSSSCTPSACSPPSSAGTPASCCSVSPTAAASSPAAPSSPGAATRLLSGPSASASRSSVCRSARLRCTRHCSIVRSRQSAVAQRGQQEGAAEQNHLDRIQTGVSSLRPAAQPMSRLLSEQLHRPMAGLLSLHVPAPHP